MLKSREEQWARAIIWAYKLSLSSTLLVYVKIITMWPSYISVVVCIIFCGFGSEVVDNAPQKVVHQLNQELQKHGFKTLSSDNDFHSSLVLLVG